MKVPFIKMHGAGNDFIVIDNRPHYIQKYFDNQKLISFLCNRHLGIGADGLILLNTKVGYSFEMVYFNSDGRVGTMCGNGGRCAVAAASRLNIIQNKTVFFAHGSEYTAHIIKNRFPEVHVKLKMNDVLLYRKENTYYFVDTGSPHHVEFVHDVMMMNVVEEGRKIRFSSAYKDQGVNVNFAKKNEGYLFVRTYERGVEDETLSCGTGVVACAIAAYLSDEAHKANEYHIKTKGGELKVRFSKNNNLFNNIYLEGPATFVFESCIEI